MPCAANHFIPHESSAELKKVTASQSLKGRMQTAQAVLHPRAAKELQAQMLEVRVLEAPLLQSAP